ncbi:MAG: acyl-CoA reductase [Haliscomenobacter sp.]
MTILSLEQRLQALSGLGRYLQSGTGELPLVIEKACLQNPWFIPENQWHALDAISSCFLAPTALRDWVARYGNPEPATPQKVGLVMAGNLPLVGFHDFLSVFAAGHRAQIKLSEKDAVLLPHLMEKLAALEPGVADYVEIVERLSGFDAVIATGSNNSARYFEAYFSRFPHIIRKNRNGVAVLNGRETPKDLLELGKDIFMYFGLGCRNVSKVYVPEGYDFSPFLETLHEGYKEIILHAKYKHNFDFNHALYLLNKVPFRMNGCLLLSESDAIPSRIAGLHFSTYLDQKAVEAELRLRSEEIQCVVASPGWLHYPSIPFGTSQAPGLADYPDGVDTMAFLTSL